MARPARTLARGLALQAPRQAACRAQANRIGGHGGALGSFLPGGDLFANSEFELNREQHGGIFSLWSRSSRSYFSGMEDALSLNGQAALETGVSMAMSAVGTRGELVDAEGTGGFALAFKADALWVGASSDLTDGPAGRLNASDAGVTRVRTALEGSRGFSLGGRVSLTPSVELGVRRDGGDAETGAGMDIGGGLALTDAVTGLSLDLRVRTLLVHQAEGFSDRGMSLSFGWDPSPSTP